MTIYRQMTIYGYKMKTKSIEMTTKVVFIKKITAGFNMAAIEEKIRHKWHEQLKNATI